MAKTKADVITEALRHIGVVDIVEDVSGEDYARTEKVYDGIFAELDDLQQIGITFTENVVPDWAFWPMVRMVAGRACTGYNAPQFRVEYSAGLLAIRAYAANEARVPGNPVQPDYF